MEETFLNVPPVEGGREDRSKGSQEAKSLPRGHIKNKIVILKYLRNSQCSMEKRTLAQSFIYACQPTLFNCVTYAFRANQSFRLSSPVCVEESQNPHDPLANQALFWVAL